MRRAAAVALAAVIGASIAPAAAQAALGVTRGLTTQPFANQNQSGTRAFGYLTVLREGLYRFEVRPVSAATVQVDGSAAPEVRLGRGAHFVLIEVPHQGSAPAFELTWVADFPDPETFLWNLFATGSPDNYSDYSNPDYDALLTRATRTFDTDERAELYAQAEAVLLADNVVLPIAHDTRFTLTKPQVKGLEMTPLGQLYLESAWLEH